MNNKTIVLVDNHYWSLNHFRGYLMRYFLNHGNKVIAYTPYPTHLDGTIDGVEYHFLNMSRTSTGVTDMCKYFFSLFKGVLKAKPDLVINYTIKPVLLGSLICRLLSIPCISMFPGISYLFTSHSVKSKLSKFVLKFAIKKCRKVLVLNEDDKQTLVANKLYNENQIIVLKGGEGVDTNAYKQSSERDFEEPIKFIMLSRLLKNKGTLVYIEAAKRLSQERNVKFYLAGGIDATHPEGIQKSELEKIKNGKVEYIGPINVHEWFPKCDCFVLPSFYNEGMNRSIMEAISYQMPVITADNKGCREMVIEGVTGYVVPKNDSIALYEAMKTFCDLNKSQKIKMGEAGRVLAEKVFDENKVLKQYINIFKQI